MDLSVTLIDKTITFADKNEMKVYKNGRTANECCHVKFGVVLVFLNQVWLQFGIARLP
jgi:hypothetical protein